MSTIPTFDNPIVDLTTRVAAEFIRQRLASFPLLLWIEDGVLISANGSDGADYSLTAAVDVNTPNSPATLWTIDNLVTVSKDLSKWEVVEGDQARWTVALQGTTSVVAYAETGLQLGSSSGLTLDFGVGVSGCWLDLPSNQRFLVMVTKALTRAVS